MDSSAKQRITGAVILVAAFVLLVPELLKGPGGQSGKDDAAAPADETGLRSYTIDIDAPANSAPTSQTPQAAVELPTPTASTPMAVPGEAAVPEAGTEDPRAQSGDVAAPSSAAPAAVAPAASAPSARVPPAQAPTPATTQAPPVQASPAAAPVAPATSAPRADTRPAVKPPAASPGAFAVQLGSFSSRDNADRLVREMTAKGFAAFVAPITSSNGRELYRVRVGPARDRAAAEALATQLRRIGQTGSIVSIS
jgi:DedD protein